MCAHLDIPKVADHWGIWIRQELCRTIKELLNDILSMCAREGGFLAYRYALGRNHI